MKPVISRRRLPPLNAMRAFESAARHESFKEAAAELKVSQSAISHQVKGLEAALGVELFVRKARAVELTRAGKIYYVVLRDAFERISEGTDLIRARGSAGAITLQAYSTFTVRWLIPRLPRFQLLHPEVLVRLHTSQDDVNFDRDDVDACVMIGVPTNQELHYDHLFGCELYPVCSPTLLEKRGPIDSPERLAEHTMIQVYPSENDWWVWLEANGVGDVDPDSGLQFDSYDLALVAALQGMGIALGQQPYMSRDMKSGMLVEIFPGRRIRNPNDWYFVCRKGKKDCSKIEALRSWLLQEVAADSELSVGRI
ncbi:MAG: transcriptional regulator GcvA [Planctomycetes bacterium]|nr:transcriptional regulator GcvA [Planctomycetota bacterium]